MRIDQEYHHFKGDHLSRVEQIERRIVDELIQTPLSDDERESSQSWELMHSSSCKAFMHVLAEKRGVPVELARVAGAVHDYYVIKTGKYKDHASLGVPLVAEMLSRQGDFSEREIAFVCEMVEHHSDKHVYSDSPHIELTKDADVFDCSLYEGTEFYYLTRKPLPVCHEYFERVLRVREELGMPTPDAYRSLAINDGSILMERPDLACGIDAKRGPTNAMIALWSLVTSTEASRWPLSVVFHDGERVRCFGPYSAPKSVELPSWSDLRQLCATLEARLDRVATLGRDGQIAGLLAQASETLRPAWADAGSWHRVREQAAESLKDFHCDPEADVKLRQLSCTCIESELTSFRAIFEARTKREGVDVDNWPLDTVQQNSVDQLARQESLVAIRRYLFERINRILVDSSPAAGLDLIRQFPAERFGCEPTAGLDSLTDPWLAVAWPRFDRFEFLIGRSAISRFEAIDTYFAAPSKV